MPRVRKGHQTRKDTAMETQDLLRDTEEKHAVAEREQQDRDKSAVSDRNSIFVLIVLYTLQGIPMGLSASIPYLLAEKSNDFNKQAAFSLVSWPFALKLLWAPLVDGVFFRRIGRRKTWLVPTQILIAITLLWSSSWVNKAMTGAVDIWDLTYLFFGLYFLCATQDIAVDGWALTMLSKKNVHLASVCNSIGQSLGYFTSFILFLILSDPKTCNKYLRSEPSEDPMVTLGGFMNFFGWAFLAVTVLIAIFKSETEDSGNEGEEQMSLVSAYKGLFRVCFLPKVKILIVILLTARVGFACAEAATGLKLQEFGVPKEQMASIAPLMFPIYLLVPSIMGFLKNMHPLESWTRIYPYRLLLCFGLIGLVYYAQLVIQPSGHVSWFTYGTIFTASVIMTILSSIMFTAQMQFFCTLSDPAIGGSYMTLLNTVTNLGSQWPSTISLKLIGMLEECTPENEPCNKTAFGFYVVSSLSILFGVVWFFFAAPHLRALRDASASEWRAS